MSTAILRIAAPAAGAQEYGITLALRDDAGQETPLAAATCPETLAPPGLPAPLSAADLLRRFAVAQGQDEAIRTIGVQLHSLLTGGGVGVALAGLPPQTSVILDIEPPALRRLPWELLWDAADHRACFLDEAHPLCRGQVAGQGILPEPEWPLRMLVIVGAREEDAAVAPQPEVEQITRSLAPRATDIDLLVRRRLSRSELVAEIRSFQPHILHFIGHGGAEEEDGDAYLELENESGVKQAWTATEIRNDLKQVRGLRLAFLNACRTSAAGMNGLWTVADAFLACGAPAVVSTRADIAGADAALVAAAFYSALAAGKAVDVAVAQARQRIDQKYGGSLKRREWGAICLQVQAPPAAILAVDGGVPSQRRLFVGVKLRNTLSSAISYVDRVPERRASWQCVRRQDKPRLIALVGEANVGKTALAQLLIVRCALADWPIRYVNLGLQREQNFLRVLDLIRAGAAATAGGDALLAEPLDDAPFAPFDQLLGQLAGPLAPGAPPPDVVRQPANLQKLFAAYRAGLDQIVDQSAKAQMVIVFDHLYTMTASEFAILREHFLSEHLLSETSKLRLVLLLRPEDFTGFELDKFDDLVERVPLPRFSKDAWDELAFQYLFHMLQREGLAVDEQNIRQFVAGNRILLGNADWTPNILDSMLRLAQVLLTQAGRG